VEAITIFIGYRKTEAILRRGRRGTPRRMQRRATLLRIGIDITSFLINCLGDGPRPFGGTVWQTVPLVAGVVGGGGRATRTGSGSTTREGSRFQMRLSRIRLRMCSRERLLSIMPNQTPHPCVLRAARTLPGGCKSCKGKSRPPRAGGREPGGRYIVCQAAVACGRLPGQIRLGFGLNSKKEPGMARNKKRSPR
jgi:hypothetical protein